MFKGNISDQSSFLCDPFRGWYGSIFNPLSQLFLSESFLRLTLIIASEHFEKALFLNKGMFLKNEPKD